MTPTSGQIKHIPIAEATSQLAALDAANKQAREARKGREERLDERILHEPGETHGHLVARLIAESVAKDLRSDKDDARAARWAMLAEIVAHQEDSLDLCARIIKRIAGEMEVLRQDYDRLTAALDVRGKMPTPSKQTDRPRNVAVDRPGTGPATPDTTRQASGLPSNVQKMHNAPLAPETEKPRGEWRPFDGPT